MGSGPRFPRELVAPLAAALARVSGTVVCGSLRRGRADVGDIDLVCPGDRAAAIDALVAAGCRLLDPVWPRAQLEADLPDGRAIPVDVWGIAPGRLGAALLHATGPGLFNATVRHHAFAAGIEFTSRGIVRESSGEVLPCSTEEECFSSLGLPFLDPQEREAFIPWLLSFEEDE